MNKFDVYLSVRMQIIASESEDEQSTERGRGHMVIPECIDESSIEDVVDKITHDVFDDEI